MLVKNPVPILEYDDTYQGMIHAPNQIRKMTNSPYCVICFFQDIIQEYVDRNEVRVVANLRSEFGLHPLYEIKYDDKLIHLFHPGIGGPLAAAFIEELSALGCEKFIACGGAGVLDKDLVVGHLVVPTRALRAEGASYHYLPASRYVDLDQKVIGEIKTVLDDMKLPYKTGMTWTTDAFYRETKEMMKYRQEEGCITVEMECASFAAVTQFRGLKFGQILYSGDDLTKEVWDSRQWTSRKDIRKDLVEASIRACLKL